MADRVDPFPLLAGLLSGGGVLALVTVPLVRLLEGQADLGALVMAFVCLTPGAALLSGVTPAVAKLELADLGRSATVFGRLSGWATGGALAGTFLTGFVIVPNVSVSTAVVVAGGLLVLAGLFVGLRARVLPLVGVLAVIALAVAGGAASVAVASPCELESDYHCVNVERDPARASGRFLELDDLQHSYVDLRDPTRLKLEYTRWMGDAIDGLRPPRRPLAGLYVGGGFTLPRYVAAERPGSRATVLEVDPDLVGLARRELGLKTSRALRVRTGDARTALPDIATGSVDLVVADAFGGRAVPWHLATVEWFRELRRVLRPGGLLAMNVIDRRGLRLTRAQAATLLRVFDDVRLVSPRAGEVNNRVLLAGKRPLPAAVRSSAFGASTLDRRGVARFARGAPVFTDDDAPADQLLGAP